MTMRSSVAGRTDRIAMRALLVLGGETALTHSVLGDLEEEYAEDIRVSGLARARWSFARRAMQSLPYLVADGLRHGAPPARARLMCWIALPGLAFAFFASVIAARTGPPARLFPATAAASDIVVSSEGPVEIPMRVLDADGAAIAGAPVRFTWESGVPVHLSTAGTVRCDRAGKASLLATLGELRTRVRIDCQPVTDLYTKAWYNLVLGGPAQALLLGGIGLDGRPVTRLAPDLTVDDTAIATVEHARLRARAPGRTFLTVSVGRRVAYATVTVFEPSSTLSHLRDDQRYVIASATLAPNEVVRWPLPSGSFSLVNHIDAEGRAPDVSVSGDVTCDPAPARGVYRMFCRAGAGASVTLRHTGVTGSSLAGRLALERDSLP